MPPVPKKNGPTLPDGVSACTMNGTSGFTATGKKSACHLHDGTPAGMAAAIAKAKADVGNGAAGAKPFGDRDYEGMLETVDIDGVELLADGGPIHGTGSPPEGDFFAQEDLVAIAEANRELASEVKIPLKIGHSRGQRLMRASGLSTDEMPAGGWVENVRTQGGRILGDYKRVPRKLAALVQSGAFRTRSVELSRITSQAEATRGKVYPTVITGVALLGAKAPAVRTLDDVLAWYSEDESRDVTAPVPSDLQVDPGMTVLFVEKNSEPPADTSVVTATVVDPTKPAAEAPALSDEQVESFATAFGIEETDGEKRREAVLAKFSELAPKPAAADPVVDPAKPVVEDPAPAKPADASPAMVSLSQADLDKLKSDAERGRSFAENADKSRIVASVDVAIRQGRLDPAKRADFLAFGEREPELMLNTLVSLPVNTRLFAIAGSDANGDGGDASAADAQYAAYAAMTGVNARSVKTTTGGAA